MFKKPDNDSPEVRRLQWSVEEKGEWERWLKLDNLFQPNSSKRKCISYILVLINALYDLN